MKITIVAGARPNFMKIAPIIKAINLEKNNGRKIDFRLVHTGQHYDKKMSADFFEQLNIPEPDVNLHCGGGSQAEQTGSIMINFEKELIANRPDLVMVVGDVTSTMACTITAKKLCIDTVHVEAGIRSGDITMPEEINRMVTDAICDQYFTTSKLASNNLLNSNVSPEKIHFVGNTMIDTLYQHLGRLKKPGFWNEIELENKNYFILTLHRPSNVNDINKLENILQVVSESIGDSKIIFPAHPRLTESLKIIRKRFKKINIIEPQPYLEFIYLIKNAKGIITDSGGITEEATVLNIPCLTMRNTTERPETIEHGSNQLVGDNLSNLTIYLKVIEMGMWKKAKMPEKWDGNTSQRIVEILLNEYQSTNRIENNLIEAPIPNFYEQAV